MIRIDSDNACSPAHPVADVAPDESAERADQERDGEQREGRPAAPVCGSDSGKNTVAMVTAQVAVDGVVEPFHEVADEAGSDDPASGFLADGVVGRGGAWITQGAASGSCGGMGRKFRYSCFHQSVCGCIQRNAVATDYDVMAATVNGCEKAFFLAAGFMPQVQRLLAGAARIGTGNASARSSCSKRNGVALLSQMASPDLCFLSARDGQEARQVLFSRGQSDVSEVRKPEG